MGKSMSEQCRKPGWRGFTIGMHSIGKIGEYSSQGDRKKRFVLYCHHGHLSRLRAGQPIPSLEKLDGALSKNYSGKPLAQEKLSAIATCENTRLPDLALNRGSRTIDSAIANARPPCFPPDTVVHMKDDAWEIQYIQPGDWVLSRNEARVGWAGFHQAQHLACDAILPAAK